MKSSNTPQPLKSTEQTYQYNYTYIETIAMVDRLPESEKFSKPWLIVAGKQALKVVINMLIANQGDRGNRGYEDDLIQFLHKTLLQTLRENPDFKLRLVRAIATILARLAQARQAAATPMVVGETGMAEAVSTQPIVIPKPTESLPSDALPEDVLAEIDKNLPEHIRTLLERLLQQTSSSDTPANSQPQPANDLRALHPGEAQIAQGLDTALKTPLQNVPLTEASIKQFVTSDLIQILGLDFLKHFAQNLIRSLKERSPSGTSRSLQDYEKLFATSVIDLPPIAKHFETDASFANLRVAGPNPVMLQRLSTVKVRFPVTETHYQAQMGQDDSLAKAIIQGRAYWVDYGVLAGAVNGTLGDRTSRQKYAYAPMALFAVPDGAADGRALKPIAIQCGQDPMVYPIVTPHSDPDTWKFAKTIVQIADANIHEAVTHFARTHLLVEPFVIATHRQLPPEHPLFKLLTPHFQGTLAINDAAHRILVAPEGGVNKLLSCTIDQSRVFMVKGFQTKGFNREMFPKQLHDRGVDDPAQLPVYPYRDDGLLIWNAIHDWVKAYLGLYYPTDQAIQQDQPLQNWAAELVAFEGGRLRDFGEDGLGKISTLAYLIDAVTMVIFTGSAQHAAVNFPQGDIMSFAPAMPTAGYAKAPLGKSQATAQDWLALLPPLDQAQAQLNLTYLLGSVYFTQLGQYAKDQFTDAKVAEPLAAFQAQLQDIERQIEQRNQSRAVYEYLKPSKIPQSINI